MSDATDPVLPGQLAPNEGSMQHYRGTLESLKDMDTDELRRLAAEAGVDGVDRMDRDHLIAKLVDEPGANEL